jgi:hypothetical protein
MEDTKVNKGQGRDEYNAYNWQIVLFSSSRAVISLFTILLTFISYMAAGGTVPGFDADD